MTQFDPNSDEFNRALKRTQWGARLVLLCVLIIVLASTCSRHGLRNGLVIGLLGFLVYGGGEFFLGTFFKHKFTESEIRKVRSMAKARKAEQEHKVENS